MSEDIGDLRAIIGRIAQLVAENTAVMARTGAFDDYREHISDLLQALDGSLRAARIRYADYALVEALAVVRNDEAAPGRRPPHS